MVWENWQSCQTTGGGAEFRAEHLSSGKHSSDGFLEHVSCTTEALAPLPTLPSASISFYLQKGFVR